MALIQIDNISVHYGSFQALDGVSCTIGEGTYGLLGPNGAGKSTFIKTLLGFNRASSGTVNVFGERMPKGALAVRQQLGYMPEREVVSPKVSAVSFLTYCGRLFGMTRIDAMERTHEVLNYVGLGEARYRKMDTYSTGMLQRVKLAQAIIHDPQLLLLDEPTNGLDPEGRVEMLDLIRDIVAKKGVTVLLSSHLLPDVRAVCDRVLMMANGQLVQEGAIADLTARLEEEYEVQVSNNSGAFVAAIEAEGYGCRTIEDGTLLVHPPEGADMRQLFRIARAQEADILHFHPARQRLEDVFMQAVTQKEIV